MIVRAATTADHAAVRALLKAAFATTLEADLVEALRADGDAVLELVADEDGRVVGQAMLSRMAAPFRALGLAPVAVAADKRRRGVAAAVIAAGLEQAQAAGWQAVFVLGDPDYYRRFGFSAAAAAGFASPYAGPYLMALGLAGNGLPASVGRVDYAAGFAALG